MARATVSASSRPPFRVGGLMRAVYAPSALHAAGFGMLGPALPLFAQQLGLDFGLIGLLVTVREVGAVASNIPAGLLVARYGGHAAMSLGIAASALGAVALGFSQTPTHLFLAVPLLGVGLATWATSRLAYVAELAPVEHRGRALALVGGSSRIGLTAGPIIGGFLGEQLGLQAAFFGHAAMAVLALALMATQRREPFTPPPEHDDRAHVRVLRAFSENQSALRTAGSVAMSLAMVRSARRVLIPLWGAWLGLDLAEIGLVIGLASAVDMSLFYPVGVVMDRWGRKWTIVPSLVALAASLAAIPLTWDFTSFLVVGLLGGLGNGLGSGAVMTMGADLAPPSRSGEFLGVWRVISDTGAMVGPALVGGIAQALTLAAAFYGSAGIGAAGAVLMATRVPEALKRVDTPPRE